MGAGLGKVVAFARRLAGKSRSAGQTRFKNANTSGR